MSATTRPTSTPSPPCASSSTRGSSATRCASACARTRRPGSSRPAPTCSSTGRGVSARCSPRSPRRLACGAVRRPAQDHRPPQRRRGDHAGGHRGRRRDDRRRRERRVVRRRVVVRRGRDRGVRRTQGAGHPGDRAPAREREGGDDDARAPARRRRGQPAVAAAPVDGRGRRAGADRAADPGHRGGLRGHLGSCLAAAGVGRARDRGARRRDVLRRADVAGATAAARAHAGLPPRGADVERHRRAMSVAAASPPAPSADRDQSLGSVLAALVANTAIAIAKGTAAALTGSPALLAETLHTIADAGNEVLLWVALRRSRHAADPSHPFGYGPERYYWALIAAIGMFLVGGALSVWEGVHALLDPRPLEDFWIGVAVLVVALVLDGMSRFVASRTLRRQAAARDVTVAQLLRESPDPTVVTVYLEDSIDVAGAALALVALILHRVTGSAVPDALATLVIGLMLGYVALRLTGRNRRLLTNQAVPDRYVQALRRRLVEVPGIDDVNRLEAVYLGPGEVLVTADVTLEDGQDGHGVAATMQRARNDICGEVPAIARLQLTPVPRG